MAITTRAATESDLPSLLALLGQLNPEDPALTPADAARVWREIAAQPGRTVLVAELDGAVVGTADCAVIANLTRGGRPLMVLENIVVDAARRRRGVGARLLEAAVSIAETAGCYKVGLSSRKSRTEAHAFYEAAGFTASAEGYRLYLG